MSEYLSRSMFTASITVPVLMINTTIAMHYVTTRLLVTHFTCASLLAAGRPEDRT